MTKYRFEAANTKSQTHLADTNVPNVEKFSLMIDFLSALSKFNAIKMFISFRIRNNLLLHTSNVLFDFSIYQPATSGFVAFNLTETAIFLRN